jgi:hypothetical protein
VITTLLTTLLGVGHLCHVESRGPDRRDTSPESTAAMGRWDTYAQPYSP